MEAWKKIPAGMLGGFMGGALVGLAEAVLIAWTGTGDEYGVFWFAAASYGLIGAGMGGGVGLGTLVLAFLARQPRDAAALSAGAAASLLALAMARFRIVRDVFAENLPIASTEGLMVHAGLAVAALVVLLVVRRLALGMTREGSSGIGSLVGVAIVLVLGGGAASVLLDLTVRTKPVPTMAGTAQGPSVILIIADTLRADYVGTYGSTQTKTPAMDRLARDGVVFENAFSNSTWTRPSVATIVTSLYPSSHKVMYKTDLLPEGVTTIAETMKDAGYRTVGYVTNINVAPSFHFEQGFEEYYYLSPEFFFGASDSASKLAFYSVLRLLRERFLSSSKWVQYYYQDGKTVNASALPWLERNGDGPFFTLIHYMDPHDPYFEIPYNGVAVARVDTPHPDPSQRDRLIELYASNVEYLDQFIGNLIEGLEASGQYEDTVIALVADHGEEFYEHEGWWHGTTLYDEESRVPFLVKLAGNARAGTRVKEAAQLLDLSPTLTGAAEVEAPEDWQGRDLFSEATAPEALFQEEDHEGNVLHSIRTERWKLILANEGNPRGLEEVELYDIKADPKETTNVAEGNPEVVEKLSADLELLKVHAASRAVSGESGVIDEATRKKLESLGYL